MSYLALKHAHILLVVISVGLFVLRFGARECGARFIQARGFRVAPHIIDTALLVSGVSLIVWLGYPLWPTNWLTVKLLLVLAYIASGMVAMKAARRVTRRAAAAFALLWIAAIAHLAINKPF